MSATVAAIIAAVLFGAGGTLFIWYARQREKQGQASLSWSQVPGRILKSELKRGSKGSTLPDLKYTYAVCGKDHTGTVANFAGSTSASESMRLVKKYQAGSQVIVSYDPANPSTAVLEVGAIRTRGMIVFGITMLVASVGFLVIGLMQHGRS